MRADHLPARDVPVPRHELGFTRCDEVRKMLGKRGLRTARLSNEEERFPTPERRERLLADGAHLPRKE